MNEQYRNQHRHLPYLHTPLRAFAADDLSFPIENIDDIEFLED